MTTEISYDAPHEVDAVTVAFPAVVVGTLLPLEADIPKEFTNHRNPWCRFVEGLFFDGGRLPKPKDGIDDNAAGNHLMAVLGSYEPSQQHKIAGAGYLASLWYEKPEPRTELR